MLVRNWMSRDVVTIDVGDSMSHAIALTKQHKIRMLPVTKEGKLVGVVSDTDLKRSSASDATTLDIHELLYLISKIKVGEVMTKNPVTVLSNFTIAETAEVLLKHNISGVPVVDEAGRVVGLITRNDIFKALVSLSALGKKGIQFAFRLEDRPGSIKEVTDIIRSCGGRLASILSSGEDVAPGYRKVYIRAYDVERSKMPQLMEDVKKKAVLLYYVDHRENKREIFES
jgi:acetoin utilization protein AcuB